MLRRALLSPRLRLALVAAALALLPFEWLDPVVALPGMGITTLEAALALVVAASLLHLLSGSLSLWERVRMRVFSRPATDPPPPPLSHHGQGGTKPQSTLLWPTVAVVVTAIVSALAAS